MEIKFQKLEAEAKNKILFMDEEGELSGQLKQLDDANDGIISKAIESADYKAKKNKYLSVFLSSGTRVIVCGLGKQDESKNPEKDLREQGGNIQGFLNAHKIKEAAIVIDEPIFGFAEGVAAANMAYGAKLKAYRFDKYFTKQKDEDKPSLANLAFLTNAQTEAETKFEILNQVAEAVYFARDLVSEPPNVLYPESYANIVRDQLKPLGVKVEIFDKKDLTKLGMGALLGVAQGSVRDARLVVMIYNGSEDKKSQPLAFVGKGVTFDTGGISLKPSNGMEDMKYDMGGSAAVVGAMRAIAGRKAKVNAVGVIGLVENMPDGNAQRPSDVVTSMSGQTIEVLNTDAEGRLVLADALWYTQDRFNPKFIIDFATLTGAVVVALGVHKAGVMSNDDTLAEQIYDSGEQVGEHNWRLPLGDEYDKQIDSKTADVQNISNSKGGGTITAGQFLQRFVNEKKWAHIDIAGVAWADKAKPTNPEGATGYGAQLVDRLVANYYED
jgi:leucyl aminopeptidase